MYSDNLFNNNRNKSSYIPIDDSINTSINKSFEKNIYEQNYNENKKKNLKNLNEKNNNGIKIISKKEVNQIEASILENQFQKNMYIQGCFKVIINHLFGNSFTIFLNEKEVYPKKLNKNKKNNFFINSLGLCLYNIIVSFMKDALKSYFTYSYVIWKYKKKSFEFYDNDTNSIESTIIRVPFIKHRQLFKLFVVINEKEDISFEVVSLLKKNNNNNEKNNNNNVTLLNNNNIDYENNNNNINNIDDNFIDKQNNINNITNNDNINNISINNDILTSQNNNKKIDNNNNNDDDDDDDNDDNKTIDTYSSTSDEDDDEDDDDTCHYYFATGSEPSCINGQHRSLVHNLIKDCLELDIMKKAHKDATLQNSKPPVMLEKLGPRELEPELEREFQLRRMIMFNGIDPLDKNFQEIVKKMSSNNSSEKIISSEIKRPTFSGYGVDYASTILPQIVGPSSIKENFNNNNNDNYDDDIYGHRKMLEYIEKGGIGGLFEDPYEYYLNNNNNNETNNLDKTMGLLGNLNSEIVKDQQNYISNIDLPNSDGLSEAFNNSKNSSSDGNKLKTSENAKLLGDNYLTTFNYKQNVENNTFWIPKHYRLLDSSLVAPRPQHDLLDFEILLMNKILLQFGIPAALLCREFMNSSKGGIGSHNISNITSSELERFNDSIKEFQNILYEICEDLKFGIFSSKKSGKYRGSSVNFTFSESKNVPPEIIIDLYEKGIIPIDMCQDIVLKSYGISYDKSLLNNNSKNKGDNNNDSNDDDDNHKNDNDDESEYEKINYNKKNKKRKVEYKNGAIYPKKVN